MESHVNQSVDKSVLLSQAMPVFERTIRQAIECERRMLVLEFKRLLDATEQDLFTAEQIERLLDQSVAGRESGK